MFGALKSGRFRSLASLILVVNVVNVGELRRKRTLAASRGFLAAARLSCRIKKRFSKKHRKTMHKGNFAPNFLPLPVSSERKVLLCEICDRQTNTAKDAFVRV